MRISDWSSDVCSSDLNIAKQRLRRRDAFGVVGAAVGPFPHPASRTDARQQHQPDKRHQAKADQQFDEGETACGPHRHPIERGAPTSTDKRAIQERSEEHTSELQSLMRISYAVFCLKKNKT